MLIGEDTGQAYYKSVKLTNTSHAGVISDSFALERVVSEILEDYVTMLLARNTMEATKDATANLGASATAGMHKTRAAAQGQMDKATARDASGKAVAEATQREKIIGAAEAEKQDAIAAPVRHPSIPGIEPGRKAPVRHPSIPGIEPGRTGWQQPALRLSQRLVRVTKETIFWIITLLIRSTMSQTKIAL
ncbi:hypothetical protein EJB05_49849, partial [Eragrostis curvula]